MAKLVAVFQIGSLGDSILSIPTLLSIKELVPGCSEYLLFSGSDSKAKVLPADVFEMAWKPSVQINYTIPETPMQKLRTVPVLLAKLRYYRPSHCVYLLPCLRTAEQVERDRRFFSAGGVKNLIGFNAVPEARIQRGSYTGVDGTEAFQRFERVWGAAAKNKFRQYSQVPLMQPDPAAIATIANWLRANRKYPEKRLIAVSPYSNYASRDIPAGILVELINGLIGQANAEIVVVGGKKDFERAAKLPCDLLNACGLFSVQESAALLKAASFAVCTDSGPMHMAAAIGVPVLVTFSRTSPELGRWLPFGQKSTILYREVECAGCFSSQCKVAGHPCMEQITASELLMSAMKLLNGLPVVDGSLNETRVLTW